MNRYSIEWWCARMSWLFQPMRRWPGLLVLILYSQYAHGQTTITRVEYYIDNDPGYGLATSVPFAGTENATSTININLVPLSAGVHVVGMRSLTGNGWSIDNKWIFLKPYEGNLAGPVPAISRVEYYVDNDPGYGSATPLIFSSGQDLSGLGFSLNLAPLSEGVHIIGVRSLDVNGKWSFDNKWIFVKPFTGTSAGPAPAINRVEYYVDSDPGYGNATSLPITSGQNLAGLSFNLNFSGYYDGVHIIGVRSRDVNGAWSIDNKWLFLKPFATLSAGPARLITKAEFYLDNDPGYGNGVPVALLPANQLANMAVFANINTLSIGAHKLFFRSKDTAQAWSLDHVYEFTIGNATAAPALIVTSMALTTICKGGNVPLGYQGTGVYNPGNQFIAELSNAAGEFAPATEIGSLTTTVGKALIQITIPEGSMTGSGYKIRVRSTNPALTSEPFAPAIAVSKFFIGNDTSGVVICANNLLNANPFFNLQGAAPEWTIPNPAQAPIGTHRVIATNGLGCKDTAFILVKQDIATWTGALSQQWSAGANWSTGKTPGDSTHVIVPAGTANNCVVSGTDGKAASVQLLNGANITIGAGRKVDIKATCNPLPPPPPNDGGPSAKLKD